jgi:lysophospholipase L1-like esterase
MYHDYESGVIRCHSYTHHLRDLLRGGMPASCRVVVHERGRSGEMARHAMQVGIESPALPKWDLLCQLGLPWSHLTLDKHCGGLRFALQDRLGRALAQAAANKEPYGWVLLLGGTNDISSNTDAVDVLAALASMHDAIHAAGARLVAMTLPPFNTPLSSERVAAFDALNNGIRRRLANMTAALPPERHPRRHGRGLHGPRAALVDLEPLLPVQGIDPEVKRATWSDDYHPTPAGYEKMAEAIYKVMLGDHKPQPGSLARGGAAGEVNSSSTGTDGGG